jgi:hypothetical protein
MIRQHALHFPPSELASIRQCAVESKGGWMTFDETSDCYREVLRKKRAIRMLERPSGVGTQTASILKSMGFENTVNCGCDSVVSEWNRRGLEWCRLNKTILANQLKKSAWSRNIFLGILACLSAWIIVGIAVSRADREIKASIRKSEPKQKRKRSIKILAILSVPFWKLGPHSRELT